ncbi:hypothetical protein [Bradyrhizobium tunisiense]|uniref:hypothetical protein n=1 Tax=Bradyrhizobium tunisiense TaxID=3278709 RepID=UPI0035E17C89
MTIVSPHHIEAYKEKKGITRVVAFSGGASAVSATFDKELGEALTAASARLEERTIEDILEVLRPYAKHLCILTGGTKWGIPCTAIRIAKRMGYHTMGVFPERGLKHALDADLVDLRVCVPPDFEGQTPEERSRYGSDWGDESSLFAKALDAVVVLSGRAGTLVELAHVFKINEGRRSRKQTPKFIVPIRRSGGTAESACYLPADPAVKSECMPAEPVESGRQAAKFLIEHLNLEDLLDDLSA